MLKLKELRFKAIGPFVDEQVINVEALGSLAQMDGENKETGGSSGSGKTTAFNALDFLLGTNKKANTVLQSYLTKEAMTVIGTFDNDGVPVTIKRGKKLSVEIGDKLVEGSNALAEEEIDKLLGMPRDLFRKMYHKRQKEGGFFRQLTPKDMHEFLLNCLGLGNLKTKTDIVDNDLKRIETGLLNAKANRDKFQAALDATRNAFMGIGDAPVKEVTQEQVLGLKQAAEQAKNARDTQASINYMERQALSLRRPNVNVKPWDQTKKAILNQEIQATEKKLKALFDIETARQNGVRQQINDLRVQKAGLESLVRRGPVALTEAKALATKIKVIQGSQCHTCGSHWENELQKTEQANLIAACQKLGSEVFAGQRAEVEMAAIGTQIDALAADLGMRTDPQMPIFDQAIQTMSLELKAELQAEMSHLGQQNTINQQLLSAFAAEEYNQTMLHNQSMQGLVEALDFAERSLSSAIQRMQSFELAKARFEQQAAHLAAQQGMYEKELAGKVSEVLSLEIEFEIATEAKKVIKSFASCSFDDALESIGNSATAMIRAIPVMRNATIQLEGLKENKDGKIKEEVNAIISKGTHIGIPIASLSGGEESSVDLAIDLAVVEYIEAKAGKGTNVFILDEPFTGMSTVDIEMALEVLKNSNTNKTLILVDHNPEAKQMVESRLVAVREGETSKIVQSA